MLQKAFLRPVVELMNEHRLASAVHVYGFRPGCSCALISELIRTTVHKASAFGMTCYIMSADIKRAFQGITHEWAQRAMIRFRVPAQLRIVLLEELTGLRCSAALPGTNPSQYCPYTKGGREGGVGTPSLFNLLVEERLDDVVKG